MKENRWKNGKEYDIGCWWWIKNEKTKAIFLNKESYNVLEAKDGAELLKSLTTWKIQL